MFFTNSMKEGLFMSKKDKNLFFVNPKKDRNKRSKQFWVFMIPVIAIVIITIVNAFFLIYIWTFPTTNILCKEKATGSTFVSTGIEIISIALAVWVGLNIVNAIEKKEFDTLNKNISDLTKEEVSLSLYNRDKEQFCQELLKSKEDPLTEHLYMSFSKNLSVKYPFDIFFEIEQLFSQVYILHRSENMIDNELINKANKGIQLINSLDSNIYEDKLASAFLKYRILEFNFYKGYCEKEVESRFNCFKSAALGYYDIAPEFDSSLPKFSSENYLDIPENMSSGNNKLLTIYMANSIGESYSKILQLKNNLIKSNEINITEDEIILYGKMALFYCGCAVKWNGEKKLISEREVYYRNYAVALENYEKYFCELGDLSENIILNYKKAFLLLLNYNEMNPNRIGYVYRTLMFYYNRYINFEISIKDKFDSKAEFKLYLSNLQKIKDETIDRVRVLYELSNLSINDICLRTYVHCMKGFALRNIILLKASSNKSINVIFPEDIYYYKKKYKSIIYTINIMELTDDFSETLKYFDEIFDIYI